MQNLINEIFSFFVGIYEAINNYFTSSSVFNAFKEKQLLNGELLSLNLNFQEIISFILPTITIFLLIILLIKFFIKLLGVFTFK